MNWNTDLITFQDKTIEKFQGTSRVTWTPNGNMTHCDAQPINKELVFKNYGFTDAGEYRQIFDRSMSSGWVVGDQVIFGTEQWLVRKVDKWDRMSKSNHIFIIISKVV